MRVFLRVLLSLDFFLLGVLLILLPWLSFWEHNFFLDKYPELIPLVLHPSLRGAVTGLGVLDVLLAGSMLRKRANVAPRT
jgi:hypothetical protein